MGFLSIAVAVFVFGTVIVIHELGHFWAARRAGILVEEFSIGMGPRLISYQPGETRYSLKLIPIGGSCKMLGDVEEEGGEESEGLPREEIERLKTRSFLNKPVRHRMFVIMAGVVMNLLLAVVFSTLFKLNNDFAVPIIRSFVVEIENAAEVTGLRAGDRVLAVDGETVLSDLCMLRILTDAEEGRTLTFEVARAVDNQVVRVTVPVSYADIFPYPDGVLRNFTLVASSPGQRAGLLPGDRITALNGRRIRTHNDFQLYMRYTADGSPIVVDYVRDGAKMYARVLPYYFEPTQTYRIGFISDFRLSYFSAADGTHTFLKAGFWESIYNGVFDVSYYIRATLTGLSRIVSRQIGMDEMGGPIMIVGIISDTTEASYAQGGIWAAVWNGVWFAAFISSNLFVLNLLPIPALDGGKMVFLTVEAIRRKRISPEKEGLVHLVGFVLLMIFAAFVAYNDILKII
jgi:regulator of sigma E protease